MQSIARSGSGRLLTDCHHSKSAFDTLFRQVVSRRDISPVAKLVHGALVSLHRLHRTATQEQIGEMIGLTRHQVWDGLQELKAAGLILIIRIGLGQANEYTLLGIDAADLRPVRKQAAGQSDSIARHSYKEEKKLSKIGFYRPPSDPAEYRQTRRGLLPGR